MSIRQATALDFVAIRKLPVQLTNPAAGTLKPKTLWVMMTDPNVRLLVYACENKIAAFIALSCIPDVESAIRFLIIGYLAVDRLPAGWRVAAEMEEYATALAHENKAMGILLLSDKLSGAAFKFYEQRGYIVSADTLIKKFG